MENRTPFWERFLLAERSAAQRYGVSLLLATASLLLVLWLQSLERAYFSSLALASVILSAIYGGRGPALLDMVVTAVGIDYLLSAPQYIVFESWVSAVHIVVHALVGLLIAEIVARLRDAYRGLHLQHAETLRAKQAREEVLAVVSHDLRSPLGAILMSAEVLRQRAPGELQGVAAGIERSGREMSRLIADLLDAVKIEKGQFRIEPAPHHLLPIVEDAVRGAQAAADAKGVHLELRAAGEAGPLVCDGVRVGQVVGNLIGNAVKFSPVGGVVEVRLEDDEAEVRIAVRDHGAGIPAGDVPRIFERWQAEGTAHKGTGLGLFIARSIAQAHGGRLEVVSTPGAGSTFTAVFPRAAA